MRWPWRWRRSGTAERRARAEAEARLRAVRRATPMVEQAAERLAELRPDEFARRVADAFGRRHA